jgi:hypothetical protein
MQHSKEGESKRGRWEGIAALEGGDHAFISEFDYRNSEIMKTSLNLTSDLAHILQWKASKTYKVYNL